LHQTPPAGIENACTRLRVVFGATVEFGASTWEKVGASIGASIFSRKSFDLLIIQECLHQTPRK
jgi:hypothetical protein